MLVHCEHSYTFLVPRNLVMSSSMYANANGTPQAAVGMPVRMSNSVSVSGSAFATCDCPLNDLNGVDAAANAAAQSHYANVNVNVAGSGAVAGAASHVAAHKSRSHNVTPLQNVQNTAAPYARIPRSSTTSAAGRHNVPVWDTQIPASMSGDLTYVHNSQVAQNGIVQPVQNGVIAMEHPVRHSSPKQKQKEKRLSKLSSFLRRGGDKQSKSPSSAASISGERLANSHITRSPQTAPSSASKQTQFRNSAFVRTDAVSTKNPLVSPARQPQPQDPDAVRARALYAGGKIGRALSACVEDYPVLNNQLVDSLTPSHCCAQHPTVRPCHSAGQPPSLTNANQAKTVAVHQQNGTVALVKLRPKNDLQVTHNAVDDTVVYANTDALGNLLTVHHSPVYANTLYETDGEQTEQSNSKRFSLPVRYGSFHDGLRQAPLLGVQPQVSQFAANCNLDNNGSCSFRPSPSVDLRPVVARPHSHVDCLPLGMSLSLHEQMLTNERSANTSAHNSPVKLVASAAMLQSSSPHRVANTDSASQLRNAVVLRNALNVANGNGNVNVSLNGNNQLNSNAHALVASQSVGLENGTPRNLNKLSRREKRVSMYEMGYGRIESYLKLERLGEGTYATVFKGKSLLTNALVALKEIRLEHDEGAPCTAIREVSLLRQLKHANIVTLHDIIHTENALTLVFEYVGKDLKLYMEERRNLLHTYNIKLFLFQLLRGLNFCHQRNILHRDLKPQNLLISPRGELKLADFGLARAKSIPIKTYSHEVVTLWYRPPDILLGSTDYSTPIDMWGVGCILFEMATGRPMFPGTTVENQLNMIFRVLGTPNETTWPGVERNEDFVQFRFASYPTENIQKLAPRLDAVAVDLLLCFLRYIPSSRMSADAAMHHRFFEALGPAVLQLRNTDSLMDVAGVALKKDPGQLRVSAMGLSHAVSIHQQANQLALASGYQLPHSHSQFMNLVPNANANGISNGIAQAHVANEHSYMAVNGAQAAHRQSVLVQQTHSATSKFEVSRRQSMLA